ncbi:MAG: hypothetical protein V4736_02610, partial [Bdellovibrionota bacterium]
MRITPKFFFNTILIFIMMAVFTAVDANAASGITYHGRILRPDGSPVISSTVTFRMEIRSGNSDNCLMYQEMQNKDMSGSEGVFVLEIGDGTATPTYHVTGISLLQKLFNNQGSFNFDVASGCSAITYSPSSREGRSLQVYFREGPALPWEPMPLMKINFVPMAFEALNAQTAGKVGVHSPSSLLRVETPSGDGSPAAALTPAYFTELMNLILGSSGQYERSGRILGLPLAAPGAGETGKAIRWNGSAWEYYTTTAGSVTSVVGTAGEIDATTLSGTATVGLTTVGTVTPGTYGSATSVPVFAVDNKGRVTTVANTTISGVSPGGVASGDLTGSYPAPTIATGAVTSAKILDGTIAGGDLASNITISTTGNVTAGDIRATGNISSDGSISAVGTVSGANAVITGNVGSNSVSTRSFVLANASNNTVTLTANPAAFTNFNFVLPTTYGTNTQVLSSDGAGNLVWASASAGSVTGLSGDVSGAGTGVITTTISANAVTTTKINDAAVTTSKINDAAVTTVKVNDKAITFAKLVDIATSRLLGRSTAGAGSPEEISIGTGLSMAGGVLSSTGLQAVSNTANLANTKVWVGDGTGKAQEQNISGDASLASDGTLTISNNAVTTAKILDDAVTTSKILDSNVTTNKVANDAISFAKIQNLNSARILGRSTAGAGDAEELSVGGGLSIAGGILSVISTPATVTNSSTLNNGLLWLGDGTNLAQERLMSGDASITNLGIISIAPNAVTTAKILDSAVTTAKLNDQSVTYSKLQNVSASSRLLGRATAGAGSAEEITVGSGLTLSGTTISASAPAVGASSTLSSASVWVGDGSNIAQERQLTGDASVSNTGVITVAANAINSGKVLDSAITTPKVADDAISFAKLQNLNPLRLLGRSTAGIGDAEELSIGGGLSIAGGVLSILSTPATVTNSSTLNNGKLWLGDGANLAQEQTMSGDASITNLGMISIAPNAVTSGKILDSAVVTSKINDKAVTYSKLQDVSASARLLGRATVGAGSAEELSLGSGLTLSGSTLLVNSPSVVGSTLNSAKFWLGDGTNVAQEVGLSGDATMNNSGIMTIVNDVISFAKLQNISTAKILGRSSAGSGDAEELSVGSGLSLVGGTLSATAPAVGGASTLNDAQIWVGDATNLAQGRTLTGDASVSNTGSITVAANAITTGKVADSAITTVKVADDAISFSKLQNVNPLKLLGRSTAGVGDAEELSIGGGLSISGGILSILSTPASVTNSSTLNNGKLWLGDGTNLAQEQTMSGDASITNLGMISIAPNAVTTAKILDSAVTTNKLNDQSVTYGKLQNVSASQRILGRATAGAGSAEELSLGSGLTLSGTTLSVSAPTVSGSALNSALIWVGDAVNTAQPVALSGDASVSNTGAVTIAANAVSTAKVLDDAISFAKLQNINPLRLIGRSTAGVGDAEELSLGSGLTLSGTTLSVNSPAVTGSSLDSAKFWLGDGTNLAQQVTLSGDATMLNTGVMTLGNDVVSFAKIQNINSNRIIGRSTAGSGDAEEILVGSGLSLVGGTLSAAGAAVSNSTTLN